MEGMFTSASIVQRGSFSDLSKASKKGQGKNNR